MKAILVESILTIHVCYVLDWIFLFEMASPSNQTSNNQNEFIHDYAPRTVPVESQGFQVVPLSQVVSPVVNREFVLILTNKPNVLRYDPRVMQLSI